MRLITALALLLFTTVAIPAESREYTFAVVPQQSAKKLARLWGPILEKLNRDTGLTLKFVTAKNIPTFEKRLAEGLYDFAYMNPYHYTVFSANPGYVALAKQRDKQIQGIMVARKDSPLKTIEELDGSLLAFPSPAAFAASILPQAQLQMSDVSYTPKYVSSHDSVYLAVARGLMPAGGGVMRTFRNTDPAVREQLRIFWKTEKYTPHAFAAHPDIPEATRQLVQHALESIESSDNGMQLLKSISFKGIEKAIDTDWNDVRGLNLTTLDDQF